MSKNKLKKPPSKTISKGAISITKGMGTTSKKSSPKLSKNTKNTKNATGAKITVKAKTKEKVSVKSISVKNKAVPSGVKPVEKVEKKVEKSDLKFISKLKAKTSEPADVKHNLLKEKAKPSLPNKIKKKEMKPLEVDLLVADDDIGMEDLSDIDELTEDVDISDADTNGEGGEDDSITTSSVLEGSGFDGVGLEDSDKVTTASLPEGAASAHKVMGDGSLHAHMGGLQDEDVVLTDAEGRVYCKIKDCDQYATTDGHCRYHYLLLWNKIQVRRKILADGKLERYVEELTSRYPDKFLEMIWRDLRTEKDFLTAIAELEIDESGADSDFEEDETQSYIDEVRGAAGEQGFEEEEM